LYLCTSIAPVATITSITFSSNKIQNRDILVLANAGLLGKMAVKTVERMAFAMSFLITIYERSKVESKGSGGQESPSGVQGRSPGRGPGDEVDNHLTFFGSI